MTAPFAAPPARTYRRIALSASLVTCVLAATVLVGWWLDVEALKSVVPSWASMKANTALGLLLCGLGATLSASGRSAGPPRLVAASLAAGAMVLGAATLAEDLFNLDLGIDQWLFGDRPGAVETSSPGRMSPTSALCLLLVGGALLVAASQPSGQRLRLPAIVGLAAAVVAIGGLALSGYLSAAVFGQSWWGQTGVAAHTATGFLLLGCSLLALAGAEGGAAWWLDAPTTAGLGVGVVLMVVAAAASYGFIRQLLASAAEVERSHETLREIAEVTAAAVELDRAQSRYILSGEGRWLAPVAQAEVRIAEGIVELRRLAPGEEPLRRLLDRLGPVAAERAAWADRAIAERRDHGLAAAQRMIAVGRDVLLSADITSLLQAMGEAEYAVLAARRKESSAASERTFLLLPVGVLLGLVTLSFGLSLLNTGIGERVRKEEEIRRLNADLERRVQARTAALETANRELEAFSYSVSHDLRAPLRTIDGFSQAVLEDYGGQLPDEGRRYLGTIRQGAQQMGRLIDDLLTFSRLSRAPLVRREVHMGDLVHDVLEDLAAERRGRQVDIRIGSLAPCQGDAALLKQVWINLLGNALKYTRRREAAVMEVGCSRQGGEEVYFVRDNGTGFDMRYAGKLFGVFQRLHRAEEFEGTGVGLAIVQRIVHRHGGRVWADAEVGRGATFHFTLGGGIEA